MNDTFSIANKTRSPVPKGTGSFKAMKEAVLGKKYELSVVFAGKARMQKLNKAFRNKNRPTNVLSFPLNKNAGEIFLCPSYTKGETVGFLLIHGLLHLKGLRHGSTMERKERKFRNQFGV